MIKSFLDAKRDIPCNIYIGQEAGKELTEHIQKAKKSIKILSPYLSASKVDWLINKKLKQSNIDIQLLTSDEIEEYSNSNRNKYNLIKQEKTIISEANDKMNKLEDIIKILCYSGASLTLILLGLYYFTQNNKILLGFIGLGLIYFMQKLYIAKMKNLRIYNYSYSQMLPFRVFTSQKTTGRQEDYLIHSKLYIIDDEILFLGSPNFTDSGFRHNIETIIKTKDKETIVKIGSFFKFLIEKDFGKTYFTLNGMGQRLYSEPINDYQNKKICWLF